MYVCVYNYKIMCLGVIRTWVYFHISKSGFCLLASWLVCCGSRPSRGHCTLSSLLSVQGLSYTYVV